MLQIMKKKITLLLMSLSLIVNSTGAQDLLTYKSSEPTGKTENSPESVRVFKFKVFSTDYELENISKEIAGNHPFGETIARKLFLLDKKYTSQVALAPGNPACKTVIKKPVIYESVKHIEKDLKRSVKKGEIPLTEAINELNTVLDVAIAILTTDTKDFEKAVESSDNTNLKIELFTKRVILNY
jgi:hypothetical protein